MVFQGFLFHFFCIFYPGFPDFPSGFFADFRVTFCGILESTTSGFWWVLLCDFGEYYFCATGGTRLDVFGLRISSFAGRPGNCQKTVRNKWFWDGFLAQREASVAGWKKSRKDGTKNPGKPRRKFPQKADRKPPKKKTENSPKSRPKIPQKADRKPPKSIPKLDARWNTRAPKSVRGTRGIRQPGKHPQRDLWGGRVLVSGAWDFTVPWINIPEATPTDGGPISIPKNLEVCFSENSVSLTEFSENTKGGPLGGAITPFWGITARGPPDFKFSGIAGEEHPHSKKCPDSKDPKKLSTDYRP